MTTSLRASVTADSLGSASGADATILVDGADTPITAAGLKGYTPTPGDRLLVQSVQGVVEVVQFLNVGNVPYVSTYRQDTDPALTSTVSEGAIWYDTSATGGGKANRRESGAWVAVTLQAAALNIPDVRRNAVELGYTMTSGGVAQLGAGTTAPTASPLLSGYWPTYLCTFSGGTPNGSNNVEAFFAGAESYHLDATKWAHASIFFGTNIRLTNKSDGTLGAFPDPTNGKAWTSQFYSWGGIARAGTTYALLGSDNNRSVDIYLYAIDGTTWNKTSELRLGDSNTFHGVHPRLVSNGTQIGMLWTPLAGNLMLRWYNPTTWAQVGSDITLKTSVGQVNIGDAYYGDAGTGLGANTLFVALRDGTGANVQVMCWTSVSTTAATRNTTNDFPRANTLHINAMSYDTTTGHFTTIDQFGRCYTHSQVGQVSGSSLSFAGRYTYYDNDTGLYPAGTFINGVDVSGTASTKHETGYSGITTITMPRRSWPQVTLGALPPDTLDVDATHVDKANQAGVYVSLGGGTMWRQAYTTVGQNTVNGFETFPVAGTPDVHDFSTAASALGKFQSAATRLDGTPKTFFDGSSTARVDGLIPPGTILCSALYLTPAGYLRCDGTAVSRTTQVDLFEAICPTFAGTTVNGAATITGVPTAIITALAGALATASVRVTGPGFPTTGTTTVTSVAGTTITTTATATTALGAGAGTFRLYFFGVGDGATTFTLPDYRDKGFMGVSATKPLGSTGGSATATLATGNLPSHQHSLGAQFASTTTTGGTAVRVTDINNQTGGGGTAITAQTGNTGSGNPFSTVDPYQATNVYIKV